MTPDSDFILDKHPNYDNIIIGAGFSGMKIFYTVPTFIFCTKCLGSLVIIHYRSSFLGMDGWLTSQLNVALIGKSTLVIDMLGLLFGMLLHGYLYKQELADVWSTGAEIKCLYCMLSYSFEGYE